MAQEFTIPATPRMTWFLVANRAYAYVFESEGGSRNLRLEQRLEFPKGRLKNREIDADRASGGASTGGGNYPVHGMVNRNRAHQQMTEVFAKQLAELLRKGQAENRFERLVLVAECRFMGELKSNLCETVKKRIVSTLNEDIASMASPQIHERLTQVPSFKLTG